MVKIKLFQLVIVLNFFVWASCSKQDTINITPNQFKGNDTERIQAAVNKAARTTGKVVIPANNANGTQIWLLDSAILLPSNITVILENCVIQLSDSCRDNMFRGNNVGIGITDPNWVKNIQIIGMGDVLLKGADNPRATGDGARTLVSENQPGRVSYGSDAGREGVKQKGDWRNIMILMAYVDGFKLKNVNIKNAHAWAVSFERTRNAEISGITFDCPSSQLVKGKEVLIRNRDGINLRHGCKNFRINNISGTTEDDFIALSILGLDAQDLEGGTLNSTMVTSRKWSGPEDDTDNIYITNIVCKSLTRAIAIRANDVASIHDVYINGIIFEQGYNAMLVGGRGYGKDSQPGKINNIHAMNIMGDGRSLIHIEEAITDCSFINGLYRGDENQIVTYNIDEKKTNNVIFQGLVKLKK
ncbi:MAG: glycosyl hydrolase family 28 protein [Fermentimonas sp.]|jgi:polygalacturonase